MMLQCNKYERNEKHLCCILYGIFQRDLSSNQKVFSTFLLIDSFYEWLPELDVGKKPEKKVGDMSA